jgi:hypothetical protein
MDYSTQRKKSMTVFAGVAAIFMVLSVVSINFLAQQFKGKQANTSTSTERVAKVREEERKAANSAQVTKGSADQKQQSQQNAEQNKQVATANTAKSNEEKPKTTTPAATTNKAAEPSKKTSEPANQTAAPAASQGETTVSHSQPEGRPAAGTEALPQTGMFDVIAPLLVLAALIGSGAVYIRSYLKKEAIL